MSITTDNLAEFVDRLADLKRALAQLNDAGTADRHLIGLETVDCLALGPACVWGTLRQCLAVWFVQGWYPFAPRPSLS